MKEEDRGSNFGRAVGAAEVNKADLRFVRAGGARRYPGNRISKELKDTDSSG